MKKIDNKNRLYYFIPFIVFALFFILVYAFLPRGGENHFAILSSKFSFTLVQQSLSFYGDLISSYFHMKYKYFWPFFIIILVGIISSWKQNLYFAAFSIFACIILFIWPFFSQGTRFIFPIIPFIIFFLIKGAQFIFNKLKFNSKYLILVFSILIVILSYINIEQIIDFSKKETNEAYTPEMIEIYNNIPKYVKENEVVGFIKPRVLRLFTNRNSIFTDKEHFAKSCANYLLIEKEKNDSIISKYTKVYESAKYALISKDL